MLDDSVIRARIIRSMSLACAGEAFKIPPNVPDIGPLEDTDILLLLFRDLDCWTAISREKLFSRMEGGFGEFPIEEVGEKIHDYLFFPGTKEVERDFVIVDGKRIWVLSNTVCCGIQNIILMLERDVLKFERDSTANNSSVRRQNFRVYRI